MTTMAVSIMPPPERLLPEVDGLLFQVAAFDGVALATGLRGFRECLLAGFVVEDVKRDAVVGWFQPFPLVNLRGRG